MSHWLLDFLDILGQVRPLKPSFTSSYGFSGMLSPGRLLELRLRTMVGTTLCVLGAVGVAVDLDTKRWPEGDVADLEEEKVDPERGRAAK